MAVDIIYRHFRTKFDIVQWVGRLSNFLAASLQRYEKPIHLTLKNDFEGMKFALKPD